MSTMRKEIEACLCANLESGLDPFLADNGFMRRKNSLIYSRKLPEVVQRITVHVEIHPKDHPNAAAVIYPFLGVSMDTVNALVKEMTGGDEALGGAADTTLQQPIEFTSAKAARARWPVYQPDSVPGVVDELKSFLEQYTLPVLDVYSTPAGICEEYERAHPSGHLRVDDERVTTSNIHVAAAMVLCGRIADATGVLERHYGRRTGTRKRYQRVFDYLAAKE